MTAFLAINFFPYLDDILASFHERFKINSNIIISLSCVLSNNIEKSSYNYLKPAIDFYKENLQIQLKWIWIVEIKIGPMKSIVIQRAL